MRGALEWFAARSDPAPGLGLERGLRLAGALRRFWVRGPHLGEGREFLAALTARARGHGATPARAQALVGAELLAWQHGDYRAALRWGEEALAVAAALGDRTAEAGALHVLGLARQASGELDAAQRVLEEMLRRCRREGRRVETAQALGALGLVARDRGAHAEARALLEESLAVRRGLGDTRVVAILLVHLGAVAAAERDDAGARARYAEGLRLHERAGNAWGMAHALEGLAALAAARGHPERALRLLGAGAALREASGRPTSPVERAALDGALAGAWRVLDPDTQTAALAAGRAMSREQAVADALEAEPAPAATRRTREGAAAAGPGRARRAGGLTARQAEVLRLVAQGQTDRQIAAALGLSEETVGRHLSAIFRTLGVSSRAAAIAAAVRHGLA